jgi:phenylpyruvate tautomerase
MPLIKLQMSESCSKETKEELACCLSKICAEGIGKPETYVASLVEDDAVIAFGGTVQSSAYVEVKSIGGLNSNLSAAVCKCLEAKVGIPGSRVYINFTDVPASSWGNNGSTFG